MDSYGFFFFFEDAGPTMMMTFVMLAFTIVVLMVTDVGGSVSGRNIIPGLGAIASCTNCVGGFRVLFSGTVAPR